MAELSYDQINVLRALALDHWYRIQDIASWLLLDQDKAQSYLEELARLGYAEQAVKDDLILWHRTVKEPQVAEPFELRILDETRMRDQGG